MLEAGIILGFIAMVGFGLNNAISQVPTRNIGAFKSIFYRQIFLVCFLIPGMFFFSGVVTLKHVLIAFGLSVVGYFAIVAFFKAIKTGQMGVIAPVANSSVVFTVLFSLVFFNETISNAEGAAITCIVMGIILISINFSDLKRSHLLDISSGILFALVTSLGWGLLFSLMKIPVSVLGPIITALIVEGVIGIFTFAQMKMAKRTLKASREMVMYLVLVGFFGAIGTLFFNLGIRISDVSLVAAITFSNPLVSTLYARFVYKEELTLQQWMAALAIIIGIGVLSYF